MTKKLDNLRKIVSKLKARYGEHDGDVRRLQLELDQLEACEEPNGLERRTKAHSQYIFQSVVKEYFHASRRDELL
jgi:hypothetical protein